MRLDEILQFGSKQLKEVSRTSFLDTEILVGFVLGLSRTELILKNNLELNAEQEKNILEFIERRAKNEPMAYLTNKKEFYGLEFYVDENVLIPRPETEVLVGAVRSLLKDREKRGVIKNYELRITNNQEEEFRIKNEELRMKVIDIGTGSGCIPIALAQNLKNVDFVAIDISEKALEVARKNVVRFGLEKRIELLKGDLLEIKNYKLEIIDDHKDIIITANLPYVENGAELSPEVKDYEPHLALFAGADGLDLYRKLLTQIAEIKPQAVFLEIDPRQVEALRKISGEILEEYEIEIVKDLSGKDRVFVLKLES